MIFCLKKKRKLNKIEEDFLTAEEPTKEMKEQLRNYLIEKAKEGDFEKIHNIIAFGKASIETRDNSGSSLLSLAVGNNHTV